MITNSTFLLRMAATRGMASQICSLEHDHLFTGFCFGHVIFSEGKHFLRNSKVVFASLDSSDIISSDDVSLDTALDQEGVTTSTIREVEVLCERHLIEMQTIGFHL